MNAGLLWFDNDPARPIAAKVVDAAERYCQKFGGAPDVCLVSARSLTGELVVPFGEGQIKVTPDRSILVNHFWVAIAGG